MAEPAANRRVGIVDVARHAGVSVATVSQVFSGKRPVSEATRKSVLQAVEELGYRPDLVARSMRTNRSHTLALIVPDITNPFFPALARGLQDVMGPAGYHTMVCSTDADPRTEEDVLGQMITRRVDAIALAGYYDARRTLAPAVASGVPVVFLGGHEPAPGIDVIAVDDVATGRLATEYLVAKGHRRIGFITGAAGEGPPADRVSGYRAALADAGLPADAELVVRADFNRAGGLSGMRRLLDLGVPPDAVVCTNDVVAVGALDAARERGVGVPDRLAVMGIDDIEIASLVTPALTTVAINPRGQGEALGRLLTRRLDGTLEGEPQRIVFDPVVVPRESA